MWFTSGFRFRATGTPGIGLRFGPCSALNLKREHWEFEPQSLLTFD